MKHERAPARPVVVGIDASRNRSGGAKAHLVGILGAADPTRLGIGRVHVWSYRSLLDALPDRDWLVKHHADALEQALPHQMWWQFWNLPAEVERAGCDILLNTDAGTVGRYQPSVVMSRDMLSYEHGEMRRYGFSKARLRLLVLKYVQAISMRQARGVIFLTSYAARTIQSSIGWLENVAVIPHGVGEDFRQAGSALPWPEGPQVPIRCLYVSNTAPYKHQWVVVRALASLRDRGYNVELLLAGGGGGPAQRLLDAEIERVDVARSWVKVTGAVAHERVPSLLQAAHVFIFASSCENMPNTLVEAMASGLPIACSNRGPMPEVLQDGGTYFDPENADSIASALESILRNGDLRNAIAQRAAHYAASYSWRRCAEETWAFLHANVSTRVVDGAR